MENYHKSVMTQQVIDNLNLKPGGVYIDATFGGGGHTRAILESEKKCKIISIDWDKKAIEKNGPELEEKFGDRIKIVWGNFSRLHFILKKENIKQVDGILADFGTSQHQIHTSHGFSFSKDTPLDMRMSPAHQKTTAADVVNNFAEKELAEIFFQLGEEKNSRKIAREIVEKRKEKKFETTTQLAKLIEDITPKSRAFLSKIHPATKVFQAIRIFVNRELENIEIFLKAAIKYLKPGGRIVCISFHSLEDRIVKTIFRENEKFLEILTKKPIPPTDEEIEENRSSRSAKMRVAEKRYC